MVILKPLFCHKIKADVQLQIRSLRVTFYLNTSIVQFVFDYFKDDVGWYGMEKPDVS